MCRASPLGEGPDGRERDVDFEDLKFETEEMRFRDLRIDLRRENEINRDGIGFGVQIAGYPFSCTRVEIHIHHAHTFLLIATVVYSLFRPIDYIMAYTEVDHLSFNLNFNCVTSLSLILYCSK